MPQQTYPAPGTFSQPNAPALAPQNPSGQSEQWRLPNSGGTDAPPFNPNGNSPNSGGLVPDNDYGDPNDLDFQGNSSYKDPYEPRPIRQTGALQPGENRTIDAYPNDSLDQEGDLFEEPIPSDSELDSFSDDQTNSPYGFDRSGYSWLTGVVDFDERDNSWHIIYNLRPDRSDKFGGGIRLLDHPKLQHLREHDVVHIEGRVDYDHRDPLDKPQYQIDDIVPVRTRVQQANNNQ